MGRSLFLGRNMHTKNRRPGLSQAFWSLFPFGASYLLPTGGVVPPLVPGFAPLAVVPASGAPFPLGPRTTPGPAGEASQNPASFRLVGARQFLGGRDIFLLS